MAVSETFVAVAGKMQKLAAEADSGKTEGALLKVKVDAIGTPADAAWNGTDPEATVISLLKALVLKP